MSDMITDSKKEKEPFMATKEEENLWKDLGRNGIKEGYVDVEKVGLENLNVSDLKKMTRWTNKTFEEFFQDLPKGVDSYFTVKLGKTYYLICAEIIFFRELSPPIHVAVSSYDSSGKITFPKGKTESHLQKFLYQKIKKAVFYPKTKAKFPLPMSEERRENYSKVFITKVEDPLAGVTVISREKVLFPGEVSKKFAELLLSTQKKISKEESKQLLVISGDFPDHIISPLIGTSYLYQTNPNEENQMRAILDEYPRIRKRDGQLIGTPIPTGPIGDLIFGAIMAAFRVTQAAVVIAAALAPYVKEGAKMGSGGFGDKLRQDTRKTKAAFTARYSKLVKGKSDEEVKKILQDQFLNNAEKYFTSRESAKSFLLSLTIKEWESIPSEVILLVNYAKLVSPTALKFLKFRKILTEQEIESYQPPAIIPKDVINNLLGDDSIDSDDNQIQAIPDASAKVASNYSPRKLKGLEEEEDFLDVLPIKHQEKAQEGDIIYNKDTTERERLLKDAQLALLRKENISVFFLAPLIPFIPLFVAAAVIIAALIGAGGLIVSKVAPMLIKHFFDRTGGPTELIKKVFGKLGVYKDKIMLFIKGKSEDEKKKFFADKMLKKINETSPEAAARQIVNIKNFTVFDGFDEENLKNLIVNEIVTDPQRKYIISKHPNLSSIPIQGTIYDTQFLREINDPVKYPDDFWIGTPGSWKKYLDRCLFSEQRITQLLDNQVIKIEQLRGIDCLSKFMNSYKKKKKPKPTKQQQTTPSTPSTNSETKTAQQDNKLVESLISATVKEWKNAPGYSLLAKTVLNNPENVPKPKETSLVSIYDLEKKFLPPDVRKNYSGKIVAFFSNDLVDGDYKKSLHSLVFILYNVISGSTIIAHLIAPNEKRSDSLLKIHSDLLSANSDRIILLLFVKNALQDMGLKPIVNTIKLTSKELSGDPYFSDVAYLGGFYKGFDSPNDWEFALN